MSDNEAYWDCCAERVADAIIASFVQAFGPIVLDETLPQGVAQWQMPDGEVIAELIETTEGWQFVEEPA